MQRRETVLCPDIKPLSASSEDYLKAVYYFSQKTQTARSSDIAAFLGVSKPSVHHAMAVLQEAGLITKPLYGEISLTERGHRQAQGIMCKHIHLKQLLISLQVDEKTAEQDACHMEHIISDETLSHLMLYFRKERPNESNPVCPVCYYENKERECMFSQDGHCRAC